MHGIVDLYASFRWHLLVPVFSPTFYAASSRYFRNYISAARSLDEVDISVHCDSDVFEWLMAYAHGAQRRPLG